MRQLAHSVLIGSLVLALLTWYVYRGEGIDAFYQSRLVDMVHGAAYRPFVGRVLVPGLARLGTAALPAGLERFLDRVFLAWTWRPAGWQTSHATEYVLVLAIMAASLVGFAAALRGLFHCVYVARSAVGELVALTALAGLPAFFGPFSRQIYDFTTLWLFTLGLMLMARSQWTAFAVLFVVASVNKETSILLTLVFVFRATRPGADISSATFRRLLVYQVVTFLVIRASVAYAFRHNPGQVLLLHLFLHNQFVLSHPSQMSLRFPLLLSVALAGVWGWRRKPIFLRQAMSALAPALLLMGITVGWIDEIRAYYEIYPVVALLAAESACRVLGIALEPSGSANFDRRAAAEPALAADGGHIDS